MLSFIITTLVRDVRLVRLGCGRRHKRIGRFGGHRGRIDILRDHGIRLERGRRCVRRLSQDHVFVYVHLVRRLQTGDRIGIRDVCMGVVGRRGPLKVPRRLNAQSIRNRTASVEVCRLHHGRCALLLRFFMNGRQRSFFARTRPFRRRRGSWFRSLLCLDRIDSTELVVDAPTLSHIS